VMATATAAMTIIRVGSITMASLLRLQTEQAAIAPTLPNATGLK